MLSCFRMPCFSQGSFFIFDLTSFSSSALKIKSEPPSSTKGPPIKIKPSATSRSINSACSSQKGCARVPFDKSRFGPAEEIITNVFFITAKPQASVHRVQPRRSEVRFGETPKPTRETRALPHRNRKSIRRGAERDRPAACAPQKTGCVTFENQTDHGPYFCFRWSM